MASDPANVDALVRLHGAGNTLLLKGRPNAELPREVLPCFKYSIIDLADERRIGEAARAPAGVDALDRRTCSRACAPSPTWRRRSRAAPTRCSAGRSTTRSARTAARTGKADGAARPCRSIVELIHRVDNEEPIEQLENTLKRDPSLAFKLLRYINSPAFGLRVEISSFRHAIMLLGYQRLKRWLALLLATASKDVNLRPVMFAAVRRGLLMEELVAGSRRRGDEERDVHLRRVLAARPDVRRAFAKLLGSIPVPERVYQALVKNEGPFQPYLAMVRAAEGESVYEYREAAEQLLMSVAEINRAQLRALLGAAALE